MSEIDETHESDRRSWVASANGHPDFPIQNLPLGIFSRNGDAPRAGVAIGDEILDVEAARACGVLDGPGSYAISGATLNGFFARPQSERGAFRRRIGEILDEAGATGAAAREARGLILHPAAACRMAVPARIGDYTDFYAGLHHAENVGRQFRPDNPLLPNYKHVPIGYHGRASSIRVSGAEIRRPSGQRKPAAETVPTFGPSRNLDYELELGIWIGPGNALGAPIPIGEAARHVAGFCLLNDWSARDVQGWEYQPLGPFLAKSFATTISPWVVTSEALAPFRIAQPARPQGDPVPLDYLFDESDQAGGALDLELDVRLSTPGLAAAGLAPHRLATSNTRHLYWTMAQMVAHHTSGGCNLQPGDLFGSGTISAPHPGGYGSLLETTNGGRTPLALASGETRRFLEDGDTVIFHARARRDGFVPIGFGECRGTIVAGE